MLGWRTHNHFSGIIRVSGDVCRCCAWRSLRRMLSTTRRRLLALRVQCEGSILKCFAALFVCRSVSSYTLDNALSNGLLSCQQWVWNYEDWYLLRATMGWFWGIWICVVRNNTVRAAATIAFCATDMIVKVSIHSYLGQQHRVKIISNRLSFER